MHMHSEITTNGTFMRAALFCVGGSMGLFTAGYLFGKRDGLDDSFFHTSDEGCLYAKKLLQDSSDIAETLAILRTSGGRALERVDDFSRLQMLEMGLYSLPLNCPATPHRLPSRYTDQIWDRVGEKMTTILSGDRQFFLYLIKGIAPDEVIDKASPRLRRDLRFWEELVKLRHPLALKAPDKVVESSPWMQKIRSEQAELGSQQQPPLT